MIGYLSEKTDVGKIHIVGYSAGTRLVIEALNQISLMHTDQLNDEFQKKYNIGNVILTGSDFDRQLFGMFLDDGLSDVAERYTIYMSGTDKALGLSEWLFGRNRLGQMWDEAKLSPAAGDVPLDGIFDIAGELPVVDNGIGLGIFFVASVLPSLL